MMGYIGRNIKKIRNVKSLSQQSFADLFSLTRGNISSYEEFRAEPKIEVLINIANYFGIPIADFLQKDLSVNELLRYNSGLVFESEKLKVNQQMVDIPFVPALYISEFISKQGDVSYMETLPKITLPISSKLPMLAVEVVDHEKLPLGCNYANGDILIFELIVKENTHRIIDKMGFLLDSENLKTGIFKEKDGNIYLYLNEFVSYPFNIDHPNNWVLRATYCQF